jgi:hypothetical protein
MQTIIKSMLAVGLFACVVISAVQRPNPSRLLFRCLPVSHGACLEITCTGVCSTACGCVK